MYIKANITLKPSFRVNGVFKQKKDLIITTTTKRSQRKIRQHLRKEMKKAIHKSVRSKAKDKD